MTSTAPTRPARNRQVSSCIANNNNSVGLSGAAQNLLSTKPIIDLVKKIVKLTLFPRVNSWESAKIPFDLAQGKLARIADELDYLWFLTRDSGDDQEPTKPAGKIADPRPSFTKDAGYEKKMDMVFVASTTTTTQKKFKLKSTNKTDDSEDDFDDVIEIDRPDPPAMKDTISQLPFSLSPR
ncbi:hypothetical protein DFH08DRAFT_822715 [Mycena albidolilacea]|uniref:Uncharacterized protein n=1 Tax=Mycena albidolilacea TaxID=1033008 RepID=A0AAD7ECN7_9AGAR|nr:hypothetical protein DFH08DRAFT_822715 [Mycena albidolilacea]